MATYESDAGSAQTALQNSDSQALTDGLINQILSLAAFDDGKVTFDTFTPTDNSTVSSGTGTEVLFLQGSDTSVTHVEVNTGDTPVLILQGKGGVDLDVTGGTNNGEPRVIIGSAGSDNITILDNVGT